jgi:DNA polymerase III alpha subunit
MHAESFLTGSSLKDFIARAKELGRSHVAYTDHGSLSSALKVHGLAKKEGLKSILGLEFYFKDPNCQLVAGTPAANARYFTATIYCEDQAAYQALCQLVSRTDFATVKINGEPQNLWTWAHLEEMSKFNTNIVLTGVHCMVAKTLHAGVPKVGEQILLKLKLLFPNRLFLAILASKWEKRYAEVVEIFFQDGSKKAILASDTVSSDKAKNISAKDIASRAGHSALYSIFTNGSFYDLSSKKEVVDKKGKKKTQVFPKKFTSVKLHKGFLPYPNGDVSLMGNRFLKALAARHSLPLLVTDYAYYAEQGDRIVQDMKLEGATRMNASLHMKDTSEIRDYLTGVLGMNPSEAEWVLVSNQAWASRFDNFDLKYDWRLAETDGDPLKRTMEIIRKVGRMDFGNMFHVEQLKTELGVIAKNGKKDLSSYFLPIYDVLNHYRENGQLTGPGRGSAAGSFLAYCMGITHVDPFKYGLSFQRFYSLDRILADKLADIDSDLEDRELLVGADGKSGYLYSRWGNKAAQIGTRQTLRLKSSIKDANRFKNGKVEPEIEALTSALPDAPQGTTDEKFLYGGEDDDGNHISGLIENSDKLQAYIAKRPDEWALVEKALGVTRAFSSHASAFVIADVPVDTLVPVRDGNITQYEAKECEMAGLIKYDLLVVSQLKDIRVCIDLINKKNGEKHDTGYFTHNGQRTYVWDLPVDLEAFKSLWGGATETCFQVNTKTATPFVMDMLPQSIEDYAIILALGRPGPMDYIDENTGRSMAQEYIHRRAGGSYSDIKILNELIPETLSVLVYQEQITKIAKEVAGFSGADAEQLRENIGKKKKDDLVATKPQFIAGCVASGKVTEQEDRELWARIETAGRYSFNKSHAVSYAFITYACIFFKHNYKLEWWTAVLSNADTKEITSVLWPYVKDMVLPPDINLSSEQMVVDYANEKIRSKLGVIHGMGEATIGPIVAGRPYKDINDFIDKDVAGDALTRKLIHVGVLDSLFPPKLTFLEKLKIFEDAIEIRDFKEKKAKAEKEGKQMRLLQPKEGQIPEIYANLNQNPVLEAAMRKSVLPSLPVDFYSLAKYHSVVRDKMASRPSLLNKRNMKTLLLSGEHLKRFDEMSEHALEDDTYFAVMGYVLESKEFGYPKANPTKRALKLVLDCDSYVSEKVLWPDFDTGQLNYPEGVKKGSVVSLFMKKRVGKKDVQITEIVLEV